MGFKKSFRKNSFYNMKLMQIKKDKETKFKTPIRLGVIKRLIKGKKARVYYGFKRDQALRLLKGAFKSAKRRMHRTIRIKGLSKYTTRKQPKHITRKFARERRAMIKKAVRLVWQKARGMSKLKKKDARVHAFWRVLAINLWSGSGAIPHRRKAAYLERYLRATLVKERENRLPVFFNKGATGLQVRQFRKIKALQYNKAFQLASRLKRKALLRYLTRQSLTRVQGVYIWGLLQTHKPKQTIFSLYTTKAPQMPGIIKQYQWKKRQGKQYTWFFNLRRRGTGVLLVKNKRFNVNNRRARVRSLASRLMKTRHKQVAWRRVSIKYIQHWQLPGFSYKFRSTPAHAVSLKRTPTHGQKFNKTILSVFRQSNAVNNKQVPLGTIKDIGVRNKVREQRKLTRINRLRSKIIVVGLKLNTLFKKKRKSNLRVRQQQKKLFKHYANMTKQVRAFEAPLPWWEANRLKKKHHNSSTARALAIFKKAFPLQAAQMRQKWKVKRRATLSAVYRLGDLKNRVKFGFNKTRRYGWINWFKLRSTTYNLRKSRFQWNRLSADYILEQDFRRLFDQKQKKKFVRKQDKRLLKDTVKSAKRRLFKHKQNKGFGRKQVKRLLKGTLKSAKRRLFKQKQNTGFVRKQGYLFKVREQGVYYNKTVLRLVPKTKLQIAQYKPILNTEDTVSHEAFMLNPLYFSSSKAVKAFDFNKFFKVNKVTAKTLVSVSGDLYSQYITNLHEMGVAVSAITRTKTGQNAHAVRVLRKYVQLLKLYFKEVYDNKFIKKVPADSAMHWIREYLRLTSSTRRRVSLWNRFNRVGFHFRPKAKEDEKRGRKKKILFKAKILFDRLFNWLYAQPNARYALAAPIKNSIVRDYIVRNQFIFKKQFKMQFATKSSMLEIGYKKDHS